MFQIEPISKANIGAAVAIADRCFPKRSDRELLRLDYYSFIRGKLETFDRMREKECTIIGYFLYCIEGLAAGISGAFYYPSEPLDLWLSWVAIDPSQQRKGLGLEVIQHIMKLGVSLGYSRVCAGVLDAPEALPAQRFYEKNGFIQNDRISYRDEQLLTYSLAIK